VEGRDRQKDETEIELINRERNAQRQKDRILKARYKRYMEISLDGRNLSYLNNENLKETGIGDEVGL